MKPKILFLDIETLPNQAYTWGKYDQNVCAFVQEGCIATVAYKWQGSRMVSCLSLPSYPGYHPYSYDDAALCIELHALLDEADVVVAHNGDSFDFRVINARFIAHKLTPPAPYKTVDTKKLAKRVARFNSNKLDDLGVTLGEGRKIKTDFDLWKGCIEGDQKCWDQMVAYNKRDVILLEKIYERLLPWADSHPNVTLWTGKPGCPKCGSARIEWRGYAMASTRKYRRFQCKDCGGWGRQVIGERQDDKLHTNTVIL